jgi:hypothetical protein
LDGLQDELTPGMRALSALFILTGEIDNGGFSAVMFNSSGDYTREAIDGAKLVGADAHAAVLERFAAIGLGGDFSLDRATREQRLEEMSEEEADRLDGLDDEFYALPSIEEPLSAYVDAHPEEFFRD